MGSRIHQLHESPKTQLGHVDMMLAVFGIKYLQNLNSLANFVNAGTIRLRMLMMVKGVLTDITDFEHGERTAIDTRYADALADFLCLYANITTMKRSNTAHTAGTRSKASRELLGLIGGGFNGSRIRVLTLEAITPTFKTEYLTRLVSVVTDTLIIPSFPKPSTAKWTKTGPSVAHDFLGDQCGILGQILTSACVAVTFKELLADKDGTELDAAYMDWNMVAGKHHSRSMKYIDAPAKPIDNAMVMAGGESNVFNTRQHLFYSYAALEVYDPKLPTKTEIYTNSDRSPPYAGLCNQSALLVSWVRNDGDVEARPSSSGHEV